MQLAGDNVFGPPRDRHEAVGVLRAAIKSGVNHIDTAQYYGPGTVNEVIRQALYPYPSDLAIVSKVGARRDDAGAVLPYDEPDQLRTGIEKNLSTLGLDRLAAVNLRLMDASVPDGRFDAQLGALVESRDEELIDGIGLSNVSTDHLRRAVGQTQIVCVQNLFNLADQRSLDVLDECTRQGIAFVPFCPLGWPTRSSERSPHKSRPRRPRRSAGCDPCADCAGLAARPRTQCPVDPGHPDPPAPGRGQPVGRCSHRRLRHSTATHRRWA
jgi:pyridoxine 4-dehydrogenase